MRKTVQSPGEPFTKRKLIIPFTEKHFYSFNSVKIKACILGLHVTSKKIKKTKLKSPSSFYLDQLQEVLKIYLFVCFQLGTVLRFENKAV